MGKSNREHSCNFNLRFNLTLERENNIPPIGNSRMHDSSMVRCGLTHMIGPSPATNPPAY